MMIPAGNALIAWNANEGREHARTPPGSIAIGPLLRNSGEPDWSFGYECTGGAAYAARHNLQKPQQQQHVLLDWYQLVYQYGIHPYTAHRAFLLIQEYQDIIRQYGMAPDKGEPGHDQGIPYGRAIVYPVPVLEIFTIGRSSHFWPTGKMTAERYPTPPEPTQ
jgi:hypothetical protein